MKQRVFEFEDYRAFVRHDIASHTVTRGYQGVLAKAACCQRSFLSQALNGHVQLTPDHAAGLCRHWNFSADETEYFLSLVGFERAGSNHLREFLRQRLTELRKKQEDLSRKFEQASSLSSGEDVIYYSAWYFTAIHVLISVPEYQEAVAIARKLRLGRPLVESVLETLVRIGVAKKQGSVFKQTRKHLHLSKDSPLILGHHAQWRQKALLHLYEKEPGEVHYTGVHSLSRADAERAKAIFLGAIEEFARLVPPSPEQEAVCLTLDYFSL